MVGRSIYKFGPAYRPQPGPYLLPLLLPDALDDALPLALGEGLGLGDELELPDPLATDPNGLSPVPKTPPDKQNRGKAKRLARGISNPMWSRAAHNTEEI